MEQVQIAELIKEIELLRNETDDKLDELDSKVGKTHAEYHEFSKLIGESIAYTKVVKLLWKKRLGREENEVV